ncbi:uncharacterized protein MAM_05865 [Metarhizium album ARSEF 1941]|uniref:Uncharacterized protein n=1 Tax=Metarhizium album (strain ARSEF 1941) TaxID=1081103 RepID=A0A0B2WRQ1_METAS|nr:uncharacterized protein MAM_05865 [Metarhizium album ARSEF 1941]KHN96279.1 hypothetical protein MAM_05865 [Metarhizium album ARSEF 1941]
MGSVAALTFSIGNSTVTLPLARTTFHNNRASTLLISRYTLARGQPELKDRNKEQWQNIRITLNQPVRSVTELELWAPLSPVTRARKITESFGNIVRGIEISGKSMPASTELEDAVNTILGNGKATESYQAPRGLWAVVSPEASEAEALVLADAPNPAVSLEDTMAQQKALETTARYLQQQHQLGSRIYQVLSGGGGWGPKKGLLSLDPQQTHFALSEEEEMERFMRTMDHSGFAPPGAHIQFFIPAMAPPKITASTATGIVFGVPLDIETSGEAGAAPKGYLVANHFGALSSQGIYLSGRAGADSPSCYKSKISVPGCRAFVGNPEAKPGGFFKFFGAGGLADAGTIALM